jgi:hypothetical protein
MIGEETHMKSKESKRGKQASRVTRLAAAGAATALLGAGIGIVGAGSAQADSNPGGLFKKNSVPSKVKAGQTFKYKCKIKNGSGDWTGMKIKLQEKGVAVHANRRISSNGDCKMHVVLYDKGNHKLRMKIVNPGNGGNQFSYPVKIKVK